MRAKPMYWIKINIGDWCKVQIDWDLQDIVSLIKAKGKGQTISWKQRLSESPGIWDD